MIIKDKPFHVPCCQAMLCWYYASPVVSGLAIPSPSGCEVDLVRRWPGFVKLEAYQVRLSRYLVMRRSDAVFDRDLAAFVLSPEWQLCDWFQDDDGLLSCRGVV